MLKIQKTRNVITPNRGTAGSAGLDFYVPSDFNPKILSPGESVNIPSGIRAKVPAGFAMIAFNKSGIAVNRSLTVGAAVVDEDYTGEIHLNVINVGVSLQQIDPDMKLIQFLLIPVSYAEVIECPEGEDLFADFHTERGSGGFGSTGS